MTVPKKYFQDKLILLLLSVNAFLMAFTLIQIALRIGSGHSDFIVQCRDCSNLQSISRFTKGSIAQILAFMVFVIGIMGAHSILSVKLYHIHRQLSVVVLAMGSLLLLLALLVSNALLMLR